MGERREGEKMRYIEGEGEIRKRGEGMKSNAERRGREKKTRREGGE